MSDMHSRTFVFCGLGQCPIHSGDDPITAPTKTSLTPLTPHPDPWTAQNGTSELDATPDGFCVELLARKDDELLIRAVLLPVLFHTTKQVFCEGEFCLLEAILSFYPSFWTYLTFSLRAPGFPLLALDRYTLFVQTLSF
jgi:hypothetical protein